MDTRFNGNGRKYQIQKLWDIHHEILRLLLLGWNKVEIAKTLGITPVMVSYTANSELARRQLEVMRGARDSEALDLSVEIKRFAPEAFETLQTILRDPNTHEKHKIAIAMDALDRAGYAPPKVIEGRFMHAHFTAEEIEEMKKRSKESGQVIEGELAESNSI
jgi:predicted transcriptional regulator